jgi:hypothetical protein
MASYLKKEISEWNTTDLCNWLLANKFRGISELFQKYSLSGYDLFYIDDDILKNELNLKSFHERKVALKLIKKLTYEHLKLNVINSNGDNVILTLDNNPETKLGEIADYIGNMFNIDPKDILFKDSTKQEVLSPTVKIVQLLILYPKIYKTLNVSNMKDYRQADEELMESGSGEFPENNNMNSNINMNNNFKSKGSEMGLGSMSGMMASGEMDFQEMNNNKFNNNNYKVKSSNTNMNYRGNNKMKNENFNFNENKKRDENNDNNNMKYNKYNNNNYMKMNNKISSNQNNQRQNDNPNDNFLLNSGSDGNAPEQNNKMNLNGSSSNMEYNSMNYRKRNYMVDNEGVEEYQENLNNERRNKSYQYNKRENNEMMDNMMDYNEGNNFGLLSSANDDEMKFKPSYQLKNNENNNNNFRDYDKSKQNYNNL